MTIRVPHPILYNFFISSSIYFFEVLQYIYLYLRLVHEFVLGDGDGARVGIVQQPRDHARLHAIKGDDLLVRLRQARGEHRLEVGREGGEDALVDGELGLLHLDPHVGEGVLAAEDVEAGQHHVGVRAAAEHELLRV